MISVGNVDLPPQLDPVPAQLNGTEGVLLTYDLNAVDPDGDTVTYTGGPLPAGATLDNATGLFSWTPDFTQAGVYDVFFSANSAAPSSPELSHIVSTTIVITDNNLPPLLDPVGNQAIPTRQDFDLQLSATDPNGDTLTYSASPLPLGATFNNATGLFQWNPQNNQSGNYTVTETRLHSLAQACRRDLLLML